MGFKVKRWGTVGSIDVRDYYAGADSVGSADTKAYVHAFNGRLVFLCYDEADASVFFTYDPASQEWTGPHAGPPEAWCHWSGFDGDSMNYGKYGEQYLLGYGMFAGTKWSNGLLNVIAPDFTFAQIKAEDYFPVGSTSRSTYGGNVGIGVAGGGPCRLAHLFYKPAGWTVGTPTSHDIVTYGPNGLITRLDAMGHNVSGHGHVDDLYWRDFWTAEQAWGDGYSLEVADDDCGGNGGVWYFAAWPTNSTKCSPTGEVNVVSTHPGSMYVIGESAYGLVCDTSVTPNVYYNAELNDIATEAGLPFNGAWEYRRLRDGLGYGLDESDLDGALHSVAVPNVADPSYCSGLGWYLGLSTNGGIVATLYALDPFQKTSWAGWPGLAGAGSIAWVGEAGISTKLVLREVLELGRDASLDARSAVDCADKVYVQDRVVKKSQAATPLVVKFQGYPTSDPDWWFPGADGDHYDGFWDLFAHDGTDLIVGRMPDPSWGALNELGQDVMYGLGRATENADLTVSIANSMKVDSTTFAGPITGGFHRQLIGCRDLKKFVWLESDIGGFQTQPSWEAKVGHLVKASSTHWDWVTDLDFKTRMPGLGEDGGIHEDWTVWCIQPIPPCRPLPRGGWLAGATLYFKPWGTDWAWDAGARDATFRDSGLSYVPSLPSYLGPVAVANSPAYYVDLDEWTMGRALYGPDALLVYDETGTFVECLSDETTYPANGRAFAVTSGPLPKVVYRVYRWGQYSDSAEYWGCWQDGAGDADLNVGMWVCYDLFSGAAITPGFGAFRGFVDPSGVAEHNVASLPWRWDTIAANLYENTTPKLIYPGPGSGEMRVGTGGLSITPLSGGPSSSRNGVRGVGSRA